MSDAYYKAAQLFWSAPDDAIFPEEVILHALCIEKEGAILYKAMCNWPDIVEMYNDAEDLCDRYRKRDVMKWLNGTRSENLYSKEKLMNRLRMYIKKPEYRKIFLQLELRDNLVYEGGLLCFYVSETMYIDDTELKAVDLITEDFIKCLEEAAEEVTNIVGVGALIDIVSDIDLN